MILTDVIYLFVLRPVRSFSLVRGESGTSELMTTGGEHEEPFAGPGADSSSFDSARLSILVLLFNPLLPLFPTTLRRRCATFPKTP